MIPDKLGKELSRDGAEPLEGTVVSVQPTASSARDLHSRLEARWLGTSADTSEDAKSWSGRRKLVFLVAAGIVGWVILVLAIWSLFQIMR